MYISQGHFLTPFIVVLKDGKPVGRLIAVDTDLKVGIRLVGFDPEEGLPITDLVEVDEITFVSDMPEDLRDLIPEGFRIVDPVKE